MSQSLRNKTIWITGASSGIGQSLAFALAREGAALVLSARNKEKLEEVRTACLQYTSKCLVKPFDLSKSSELEEMVKSVQEETGGIDILINNAGQSQRSLAKETPVEIDRNMMELNFFSAVTLTKLVLPRMLEKQSGHIVVISSITGKFGFPLRTAYSAAKHALQGYFESLRAELKSEHVKVTIVSPGRIRTNISYNALTSNGQPYNKLDEGQASGMDPEVCASKIVTAIKKERKEILVGGKEIIMVYIRRFFPVLYHRLVTRIKN